MRTQSEIKRNNIRKANLILESKQKNNRGNVAKQIGLFEQCGVGPSKNLRDTEGIYMGTPTGTEPQLNFGEPNNLPIDIDWDGDMPADMDDEMALIFMQEKKNLKESQPCKCPDGEMALWCCGDSDEGVGGDPTRGDYEDIDHSDRDKFDGRKSKVIGVDSNIEKQRLQKESYKAVSAKPLFNSWGNKYNQILNEGSKVNGAKSLINRMKKIIR